MLPNLKEQLISTIASGTAALFPDGVTPPVVELSTPSDKKFGELATSHALKCAKLLQRPPMDIAGTFVRAIETQLSLSPLKNKIVKIDIQKPGFINFYLAPPAFYDVVYAVLKEGSRFGQGTVGAGKKIQIEFVSANPTGPLSVAHARQAAVGGALANILNFLGYEAVKEYYVNDEGNQINILGRSIESRAREILGENVVFPEEGYQGDYIRDMAQIFLEQRTVKDLAQLTRHAAKDFAQFGVDYLMDVIKRELDDFGVRFDVWSYQSKIAHEPAIRENLAGLKAQGFLYEKEGALWFETTRYGDDKDRVVQKSDGSYTYFTPDIVYHKYKFSRGFHKVVNIWGPDHHGYIPRLTAAVQALGQPKEALQVLIVQLATIFRDGKPVSMSTRRGQYISLREVLDEVGADAARYFFLMRHISAHLEFDLDVAKKQSPENPVYYIQYAHARIHSVTQKARELSLFAKTADLRLLKDETELDLIKKIGFFPEILLMCHDQMDPFAVGSYLLELATCFHKFYDQQRVVDPENPELSRERLALLEATRIVLANGLKLLGLAAPQKM